MKPRFPLRCSVVWLLASMIVASLPARAADEAAIQREIETVRKATLERSGGRVPDNFENYVRDTGKRNHYQREFHTALTNGNATALALVFKEFPELGRPQTLNSYVLQSKSALHYAVERDFREVIAVLLTQKTGADAPPYNPASANTFNPPTRPGPGFSIPRDTPLHLAVRAGNLEVAKLLLDAGADLEALDQRGSSPLRHVVQRLASTPGYGDLPSGSEARANFEALLTFLLKRGAAVLTMKSPPRQPPPIDFALQSPNVALVDTLLTNALPRSVTNQAGDTLLHIAIANGRTNALRALLSHGPPLEAANANGLTPLRLAASLPQVARLPVPIYTSTQTRVNVAALAGFHRHRCAELLLAAGAKVDAFALASLGRTNDLATLLQRDAAQASARDSAGRSPLHFAVSTSSTNALKLLLAAKADTEVRDAAGQTPLMDALAHGRTTEAALLLAAGAKASGTNATGHSTLHMAVFSRTGTNLLGPLLAAGANVNTVSQGHTPLHSAVIHGGDTNLIAALVAAGADVTARDAEGKTSIQLAALSQRFDLVAWFEAKGNVTAAAGPRLMTTPLHVAAAQRNFPQALNLLTNGADVNARDERGLTPLAHVVATSSPEMALLFLTNGANVNLADTNGITPLRTRFFAVKDLMPNPVPKPGFSKLPPPTAKVATPAGTRVGALPPAYRPTEQPPELLPKNVLLLLLEHGADPKLADAKG